MRAYVDSGMLAGLGTILWRDGRVLDATCAGWGDIALRLPVECDTIFRIASLTKPITSVAALMLLDEGRFALDDPIARWAPEFCRMRVLRSRSGPLDDTVEAQRPITFEDLLTHRSGLTYGGFHHKPLAEAFANALGGDIDSHLAPDDWIKALASLPLIDQPGAGFHYGHSTDLLGLLIARMEDAPLGEVLRRRIFDRLGMQDTGFAVPREKRHRRAKLYGFDEAGALCERLTGPGGSTLPERPEGMAYESGGQGLWSTLNDYLAFARMFACGGTIDGIRLLRPETFALMVSDHLTETQRSNAKFILGSGHGFGLGVAVVVDPDKATPRPCGGGRGSVGWPGAFGGWWRADPNTKTVMILLAHNIVELEQLMMGIGTGVFAAIDEFQALASDVSVSSS